MLIGGQAVAFWAEVYRDDLPPDLRASPLTSKDLDFSASGKSAVRLAATRLGGTAMFPTIDDATPNMGVVTFVDDAGKTRAIDFLEVPFGLPSVREVIGRAQKLDVLDDDGARTGQSFLILHPVHMLRSRVANVAALPGGDTPQGVAQLRAAIACSRGFIRQVGEQYGWRRTYKMIEEVFEIACSMHGRTVHAKVEVDPLDAILLDERMSEKFRTIRYPQMVAKVQSMRVVTPSQVTCSRI